MDGYTQVLRELPYGTWVLLEMSAYKDHVRLVIIEDALCSLAVADSPDGRNNEVVANSGFDSGRIRGVVSLYVFRREGQLLFRVVTGGGDVQNINTMLFEELGELDAVL